jgi:hypothetical protein
MAASVDRKRKGTPLTEEEREKLRNMKKIDYKDRTELSDLPRWAKTAMVHHEVMGETWAEAAKPHNRKADTLLNYAKSPAGHKWRAQLRKFADDPVALAEAYIRGNALNITLDRIAFLEMAKQAGDFAEADKMARDLQDRIPELAKKSSRGDSGAMTIHLTLPGGFSLDPITVQSASEPAGLLEGEVVTDYEIVDE